MVFRCEAIISTSAARHNVLRARELAGDARIAAVVKSNAYGHGDIAVARAVASLVDAFAVSTVDEAESLRRAGIRQPLWLLSGCADAGEMEAVRELDLTPFVHDPEQLAWLRERRPPWSVSVILKLDTGMGRLGFACAQAASLVAELESMPGVRIGAIASHLACADEPDDAATLEQIRRFRHATAGLAHERCLANSAGVAAWPDSHYEWIRPGIMLYGASPLLGRSAPELGLRPVMTLTSRLIAVRRLEAGSRVGYGGTWTCSEPTRIGVVACGYGHGYPRHAASGTPVLVNGRCASLIGRVSMDMLTVDLGTIDARVGDPVVLWGEGLPVDEIARAADTIPYELLVKVTGRVLRTVTDDG